MERELIEGIIQAINVGDTGRAAKMASAALERAEQTEPEAIFATEYEIMELKGEEAKLLVRKAVDFYRSCGREVALAEFSNPKGRFRKDQLYVYAIDSNGLMLAHPINEKYIGMDFLRVVDFEGRPFMKEIVGVANAQGCGWVEYKWLNPLSGYDELKTVYFEKHNDLIICSGVYDH